MAQIFSGTYTTGIVLNNPTTQNPATIASGAYVTNLGGAAISGSGFSWTLANLGTVRGAGHAGVKLVAGGMITNYATGLFTATNTAIYIAGGAGTVINFGTVEHTGTGTNGQAVYLGAGGTVTNYGLISGARVPKLMGSITGYAASIEMPNGGTIRNFGTINTTNISNGINLQSGGTVINGATDATTATISGSHNGLYIGGHLGTATTGAVGLVFNYGTIQNTDTTATAVKFASGGTVTNRGLILGAHTGVSFSNTEGTIYNFGSVVSTTGIAIDLANGGTVVNSGAISGSGTAIHFGGLGSNLLVLEHGFVLSGAVAGNASASNTVELAGSVGAAVTANYSGLTLTGFSDVLFGISGYDTLQVSNTGGTLGVTISGFGSPSELIDLTAVGTDGTIAAQSNTYVTITGSLGSETLLLDGSDSASFTTSPDGGGGTDLTPVCYCRGTMIMTENGKVAVEDLAIGDLVMTLSGGARPVKWVGWRAYGGRFMAGNRGVLPVRITAGALADGVPARDLCVSPGHALFIAGVLVRAETLINGATIVQDEAVERVDYFHIELETHDILIAEGAPAESYVDCDNRSKFHNAAEFSRLYPDDKRPHWQYCAPLLEWESPESDAIRATLMGRAGALGHRLDLNPDLHIVVDGTVVPPAAVDGRRYRFAISAGAATVSLASRTVVPAETRADARDRRRLGVPVGRLVLYDPDLYIDAGHGHRDLAAGFHDDEASHRWTHGWASLPERWLRAFPGDFTLEVHLVPSDLPYRLPHSSRTHAAA